MFSIKMQNPELDFLRHAITIAHLILRKVPSLRWSVRKPQQKKNIQHIHNKGIKKKS